MDLPPVDPAELVSVAQDDVGRSPPIASSRGLTTRVASTPMMSRRQSTASGVGDQTFADAFRDISRVRPWREPEKLMSAV